MKAFLSHSSSNKSFVEAVYKEIGAANCEYDTETFSTGDFNLDVIRDSISRCQIFFLFATNRSLSSGYVDSEISIARELQAQNKIKKILTFCLDGVTPEDLPHSLNMISAVRRPANVGSVARQIRAELIQMEIDQEPARRPYLGRDTAEREIKARLAAPEYATPLAIALSGVDGVGRRTLAGHVLADVYPGLGRLSPMIPVGQNYSLTDLFIALTTIASPVSKSEISSRLSKFEENPKIERQSKIVDLVRNIYNNREIIFLVDTGGLLEPDGGIHSEIREIFSIISKDIYPYPHFVLILFRTPPIGRRDNGNIYYFKVDALDHEDIKRLVALSIKTRQQIASSEEIAKIVDLIDGHPYNLQFLLRLLDTHTISSLVADPSDLIAFKRRQGDDFVRRLPLEDAHFAVLGALRILGQASVELISSVIDFEAESLARALKELEEYHCIERLGNICSINRPLRAALDRAPKVRLTSDQIKYIQNRAISIFNSYKDEDEVDMEIISAAARAAVFTNSDIESLRLFVSPSSALLVARQLYDLRRYSDCARVANIALGSSRFITDEAIAEAIRLRCLSLARLGDDVGFEAALSLLDRQTTRQRSLAFFLEGFRFRLNGEPDKAIEKFRKSYALIKSSFTTIRELSHALMVVGDHDEAMRYAEQALVFAPSNPYVIDMVLALRIGQRAKISPDIIYDPSISDLLDRLEKYGDEEGRSFYAIRMADIYRRAGDEERALDYANRAIELTPNLVPAHLILANLLIKKRKFPQAAARIDAIQRIVQDKTTGEMKSYLPDYVSIRASYLIESGEISDAINLLMGNQFRLRKDILDFKRKIGFAVSRDAITLESRQLKWLQDV